MCADEIKNNFFCLSFSRQIKILDLYLNDIKMIDSPGKYDKIFEKYLLVVKKFYEFKDCFKLLSDDDRKKMRSVICKCRSKINPNNFIEITDSYNCNYDSIDDSVVDKYIYDSFSYSKSERIMIASDFFDYHSDIVDYNFDEILGLFDFSRDFFNNEIRKISGEFYSLYLLMGTVDRMKYIWYLCHFDVFSSEHALEDNLDMYHVFETDRVFIKPLHLGSKEVIGSSKKLSKYFKIN